MSNKNNRVKRLEKIVKVEIQELQEDVHFLNEENSELRRMLDEQNDYIKQGFKELREALTEQHQYQGYLKYRLECEIDIRRQNDNRIVPSTWIGRLLLK
ncbi:MAG: hypothetical protein AB9836_06105 [Aminipila sp.]